MKIASLFILVMVVALQDPVQPQCHDYPIRKGRTVEQANCHCELVAVTKPDGTKVCEVRHYEQGMPNRCGNDCHEEHCACHPDEGCAPPGKH